MNIKLSSKEKKASKKNTFEETRINLTSQAGLLLTGITQENHLKRAKFTASLISFLEI